MNPFEFIVGALASNASDRVLHTAQRQLTTMTDCRLSGDDSPLRNVWEEVCAQVQGEQSTFWSDYEDLCRELISREAARLNTLETRSIWLQTPQGIDWLVDSESAQAGIPHCEDDVTAHLFSTLLGRAAAYHSDSLDRYLAR